jgi:hypothetical protein
LGYVDQPWRRRHVNDDHFDGKGTDDDDESMRTTTRKRA